MTTPAGNTMTYAYVADGAQRNLASVAWGRFQLLCVYEPRPDRLSDASLGFLVPTNQRCARIELHSLDATPSLVRSWELSYVQGEPADCRCSRR